ncbi:hypothetical protein ACIQ69_02010 [Bacillus paramycoides]|uniref:hypothetical protein n=1 Tax=Bacillus paramycoides TaxID=2026194 RepID=UPI003817BE51
MIFNNLIKLFKDQKRDTETLSELGFLVKLQYALMVNQSMTVNQYGEYRTLSRYAIGKLFGRRAASLDKTITKLVELGALIHINDISDNVYKVNSDMIKIPLIKETAGTHGLDADNLYQPLPTVKESQVGLLLLLSPYANEKTGEFREGKKELRGRNLANLVEMEHEDFKKIAERCVFLDKPKATGVKLHGKRYVFTVNGGQYDTFRNIAKISA